MSPFPILSDPWAKYLTAFNLTRKGGKSTLTVEFFDGETLCHVEQSRTTCGRHGHVFSDTCGYAVVPYSWGKYAEQLSDMWVYRLIDLALAVHSKTLWHRGCYWQDL